MNTELCWEIHFEERKTGKRIAYRICSKVGRWMEMAKGWTWY
jgi:uncharacterized paraquat-inducible protein A